MSPTKTWSAREARQRFSDMLDAAESGAPQRISRRGKASFLVVAEADWDKMSASDASAAKFARQLLAFPGADDDFFLPRGEADRPVADFDQEQAG